jgi:hypothetical protein
MAIKFQFRRDTAATWESENPILSEGEMGLDLTNNSFKIGDGTSRWNELNYYYYYSNTATQAEAEAGTSNTVFMTPLRTAQAIVELSPPPVIATQAEAEAGTANTVFMTPLRTAEAIAELSPAPVIATQAEAEAGTANDKFMTPLRTAQAIVELSPPPVIATQAEAEAGTSNTVFMTPLRTAEAIAELANFEILNITLLDNGWTGETAPYTQTVNVASITSSDNIFVDLDFTGINDIEQILDIRDQWTLVYYAETGNGTITFSSVDIPEYDIPLQIRRG